ncbi:tetratricopeptide repeat protein [Labrenzia sp. PHM005]|uniref:tetratricopeptide repeat protein n=1 Tax=Labrenzia sp. PHM005 TaxID=2590016 RepID=UPI00114006F2|nr:hypothetical protein [Labrenzia sp. PHM005]QDG78376.1 hypothetical protein FJ695_22325 [Labrenzia sp. PHM005]
MPDQVTTNITREFHRDSPDILSALHDVLASPSFSNADRLKSFLEYVVTETLCGRSDAIRGKTIAQDVYGRTAATDGDPENVVRVDARRLRRRLADYYADEGRNSRIRIHIDSGGYVPRFEYSGQKTDDLQPETAENKQASPETQKFVLGLKPRHLIAGGLSLAVTVLLVFVYLGNFQVTQDSGEAGENRASQRQALLEKSPTALQAVTMAEQARDMMLPLFDLTRQKLSLGFFQQAINLDPGYSGGYAGAAQILGTLAVLSPPGPQKTEFTAQSRQMADKAIELNPTDPWSQSAASWSKYAIKEYDEAVRLSALAFSMAPDNHQILEIYGAVALWNGEFPLVLELLETAAMNPVMGSRSGAGNVYAAAAFFLEDYKGALKSIRTSTEAGGPVSPAVVAIQTAASHASGNMKQARRYAAKLQDTWPSVPIDKLLLRLFRYPEHPNEIIWRLKDAGWQNTPSPTSQ